MKTSTLTLAGLALALGAAPALASQQAEAPPAEVPAATPATPAEPATPADPATDSAATPATPADPATPAAKASDDPLSPATAETEAKIKSTKKAKKPR